MSITAALLKQLNSADDDRIIRAMNALRYGDMEVAIIRNDETLTAEVTSYVVLGKKNPVEKITTYSVLLTPDHYECSCKDFQYRSTICKHVVCAAMVGQQAMEQEQKQAA